MVVCHGETIAEPVAARNQPGGPCSRHRYSLPSRPVDRRRGQACGERGICLEITTRKGHSLTNGHVARLALAHGAGLVVNTDSHAPGDLVTLEMARKIALGAGLCEADFEQARRNSEALVEKARGRNQVS